MKNIFLIATLMGIANSAAAHTTASHAGSHTSLQAIEHMLPVVLFLMLVGLAIKIFRKT